MLPSKINTEFNKKYFRPIDNMVWDISTGRLGIIDDRGIIILSGDASGYKMETTNADTYTKLVQAFARPSLANELEPGDIVYNRLSNSIVGWIVKSNGNSSFQILKMDGTRMDWSSSRSQVLDFDSINMAVKPLTSILGTEHNLNQLQNSMMLLISSGVVPEEDTFIDILPILLIGQLGLNFLGQSNLDCSTIASMSLLSGNIA